MSAESFVKTHFCLNVAVYCSEEAKSIVNKNNLTFCEMLRPFEKVGQEVPIRDLQGHAYNAKDMRVRFSEPSLEPNSDSKIRLLLDDAVHSTEPLISLEFDQKKSLSKVPSATPWYERYCNEFLTSMHISQHEYLQHYLCTLYIVSSNSEAPLKEVEEMRRRKSQTSGHSLWFPQSIEHCVVLHDNSLHATSERAEKMVGDLKTHPFLGSCYLLPINSRRKEDDSEAPLDPWTKFILRKHDLSSHVTVPSPSITPSTSPIMQPNGPVRSAEARDEARLVDLEETGSTPTSPIVDPLIHLQEDVHQPSQQPPSLSHLGVRFGRLLTYSDHDSLKRFVLDLLRQILVPFLVSLQKKLNDQVKINRGSKFWKGGWKSFRNLTSSAPTMPSVYSGESQEQQTRLLADISLLLQNYDLSYQLYHTLKGDYKGDRAWMYYAGAMEMAGIACYLNSQKILSSYFEESINFYLNHSDAPHFSFRVLLVYSEILKGQQKFREAALMYVKMSSEPKNAFLSSSDLKSALAFEEAANCFLYGGMGRKFCLYIILAAHRYNKARHPLQGARAHRLALSVLRGKGWGVSESYIQTSLAKHYTDCQLFGKAREAYESILLYCDGHQSLSLCKGYINVLAHLYGDSLRQPVLTPPWTDSSSEVSVCHLPVLAIPTVLSEQVRVYFCAIDSSPDCQAKAKESTEGAPEEGIEASSGSLCFEEGVCCVAFSTAVSSSVQQNQDPTRLSIGLEGLASEGEQSAYKLQCQRELEAILVSSENGRPPKDFRPSILYMSNDTDTRHRPTCVCNEPVAMEILFKNKLQSPLYLSNICLTWKLLNPATTKAIESSQAVFTEVIQGITFNPFEEKQIRLHIIPQQEGILNIVGVMYTLSVQQNPQNSPPTMSKTLSFSSILSGGIKGYCKLQIQGARLNKTKVERESIMYANDQRLSWVVCPPAPRLQVRLGCFPTWLLVGEVVQVPLTFVNKGQTDLVNLSLATSLPECFAVVSSYSSNKTASLGPVERSHKFELSGGFLPPGGQHKSELLVQSLSSAGRTTWNWLFHHEAAKQCDQLSHRILPFSCEIDIRNSLDLTCTVRNSYVAMTTNEHSFIMDVKLENKCPMDQLTRRVTQLRVLQLSFISWRSWTVAVLDSSQGIPLLDFTHSNNVIVKMNCALNTVLMEQQFLDKPLGKTRFESSKFPILQLLKASPICRQHLEGDKQRCLLVVAVWEANIPLVQGFRKAVGFQSFPVTLPSLYNVEDNSSSKLKRVLWLKQGALKWCLQIASLSIVHDFRSSSILCLPVDIHISNTLSEIIAAKVILTHHSSLERKDSGSPTAVQWGGTVDTQLKLFPYESICLRRNICILEPNIYELSGHVHVHLVEKGRGQGPPTFVPQACLQHTILTVYGS